MASLFASPLESFRFMTQHAGFTRAPLACIARVAAWYAQLALGRAPTVEIPQWNARYELPKAARGPAKVFYVFREDYEPEVRFFAEHVRPGDVFIDVGANFGLFTVLASRRAGAGGKVLAFEPWAASAEHVARNILINDCGNVTLHRCALSDRSGTAKFSVHDDCGRNSLGELGPEVAISAEVKVERLDALAAADQLERIDWMKIDVEGAEELVLRGAPETLARCKPAIVFETTNEGPLRLRLEPFGAWDLLAELGYHFFDVDRAELPQLSDHRLGNTLAVHPENDLRRR